MKKKMITTLELNGRRIETKDDLKDVFDANGFIERRAKISDWLKDHCSKDHKKLSSIESDDEWIKKLADILGCQEKYKEYLKVQTLNDEEKRKLVALIRSDKLSDDTWVYLVRKIKYKDVEGYMTEEEFNKIQEAVKKKLKTAGKRKKNPKNPKPDPDGSHVSDTVAAVAKGAAILLAPRIALPVLAIHNVLKGRSRNSK